MRSISMTFLILLFALYLTGCANNKAVHPVNLIILVQDSANNNLPQDHQAVRRLINQVSDELISQGISVYDEATLALDDFNLSGNRTKAALLDIARSTRSIKLDYVVILNVDALVKKMPYGQKVSTLLSGQMIKPHSGKVISNFSFSGDKVNASNNCSLYCLKGKISDSLKSTSGEVSAEILSDLPSINTGKAAAFNPNIGLNQDYSLVFDGFTQQHMADIEEYLVIFSGYRSMRSADSSHTFTEISYQSNITELKLNRNLKRMLTELNIPALINQESNVITIKRITLQDTENNKATDKKKFEINGW
ncbi:MAG: hypothetical protein OCD76_21995 [Reichenbachiella sp.]